MGKAFRALLTHRPFPLQLRSNDVRLLQLTTDEIVSAKLQFKLALSQLHQAGYCHADVAGRNLCVRRDVDAAGQTRLECRLIDLSETYKLSERDEQRHAEDVEWEFEQLKQVFEDVQGWSSSM